MTHHYYMFLDRLNLNVYYLLDALFFVLFLLAIVLSVLLRFTDSDYPFGIFELFLNRNLFSVLWIIVFVRLSVFL